MLSDQRSHIDVVMKVAERGIAVQDASRHEVVIRESWLRCVQEHRLDPTRMQEAVILPAPRLREHQDQMDEFLHIARHGLEALYHQVAGLGYVVLLTDAKGITVDFIGDLRLDFSLRKAGLYLGADWSEAHAGTCGVGTCISTGQALTVHLDDHFDATHIPLTCTTSPIYDSQGQLIGVLDISALSSPKPKESQALALQLVKLFTRQIEDAAFLHRHRKHWILRLSAAPQFLDVNPEFLLALNASGQIVGHNRGAQLGMGTADGSTLIGQSMSDLLEVRFDKLSGFIAGQNSQHRAVMRANGLGLLFMTVTPPPVPSVYRSHAERAMPAPLAELSGGDPAFDEELRRAAKLVDSPISILVTGETGCGKEFFAKAMHASSERRRKPFMAVNCAAIPENLIESELFGHVAGSFSGALPKGKRGLILEADGGTLFLDEIGDMPLALQGRLLRVLSEREVHPVGAARPVPVNIRVIAATHAPLETMVRQGRFRDDLYYRLNGAQFSLPALRERTDLRVIIQRLLGTREITEAAMDKLLRHSWPGNLRELRNSLDYAASMAGEAIIDVDDLPLFGVARPDAGAPAEEGSDAGSLLVALLKSHRWNVSAVARSLGVARMTIYRRMKRLGIAAPNPWEA